MPKQQRDLNEYKKIPKPDGFGIFVSILNRNNTISAWRTGERDGRPSDRTTSFLDRKKYWYAFTFRIATQI